MDLFIIKKILGLLLMPLPIISLFSAVAIWQFFRLRRRTGLFFASLAMLMLLAVSTPFLPNQLLGDLEQKYRQFDLSQPVDYIFILGGGHTNDARLPITAQLTHFSLARVAEAVRISQYQPRADFVVSGSSINEPFSTAYMHAQMLMTFGVAEDRIRMIESPRDTEDEAMQAKILMQGKRFALVTSASHMQRAMSLFEAQGLHPIPAPTEHLVKQGNGNSGLNYIPHSNNLKKFERWWYEFLGRQWLALKALF